MASGVFLIQEDGSLVEMEEEMIPSEDYLQELLAKYPNLLAGNQIDDADPRKWLLITREAGLPGEENGSDRWSIDHLFLDQDAIPTLVEVKRSDNTDIRRKVVGQMLDYAANAVVYLPIEKIQAKFEEACTAKNADPTEILRKFLGTAEDQEDFWQKAKANLHDGKIRMLFVADEVPAELRSIVEFLNEQMDPAEVLAVEIKQYAGKNMKTLVPRVMGQTEQQTPEKIVWNEKSFFETLKSGRGDEDAKIAKRILDWAHTNELLIDWGRGSTRGMFQPLLKSKGCFHHTISVWTHGKIQIEFVYMEPPFDSDLKRQELRECLNRIQGVSIPEDKISGEPPILLSIFKEEAKLEQFLKILDWLVEEIRKAS